MLKNLTQFKSTIQEFETYFLFDQCCPLSVAKEALFEAMKWIGQIEDQLKAQQEAQKNNEEVPEKKTEENEAVNEQPIA